jgi:hypothetical protein
MVTEAFYSEDGESLDVVGVVGRGAEITAGGAELGVELDGVGR